MSTSHDGEDDQSIGICSQSSCISYEVHPSLVFEELVKQVDYDSDEESQEEDLLSRYHKTSCDNLLGREIEAETDTVSLTSFGSSKGVIPSVTSDLSICFVNKNEEIQPNSTSTRLPHSKVSVLAMFEKRIIDKGVKAGKIYRTRYMDASRNGNNTINMAGSAYSFKRASSSCEAISEDAELSSYQNETFDNNACQNLLQIRRKSAAASAMGHAMLGMSLSKSASRRKSSAPPLMGDAPKREVSAFAFMKDINDFQLGLASELVPQENQRESEFTLDTAK